MKTIILTALFLVMSTSLRTPMEQTNPKPEPAPEVAAVPNANYPPPAPSPHPEELGRGIQRTMRLLATSTPERPNTVRILFYGQSITEQNWSKQVADDLRQRFPSADLHIENRAIGGFASQLLIRPAEHDVYPFYPDLVIFHVYGANDKYEEIIQNIRSRTTAEVLMQKDHVAAAGVADNPDEKADKGLWWDWKMNHEFLPQIAKKYDCGLVDVRSAWLDYLKANNLQPQALLVDGVHLNEHGNFLMARLIERYLVYRPDLPQPQHLVRTVTPGKDVPWKNNTLTVPFTGNRLDVQANKNGQITVRVDGKRPSEFPGAYAIMRPQPGPWSPVALVRVDHERPLLVEDWTLNVTSIAADGKSFTYSVRGSKTGPDGSGNSDAPFVSKSGRVKIEPEAFFRNDKLEIPADYTITWQVTPLFADTVQNAGTTTVVQGIENKPHVMELISAASGGFDLVQAIRVYRPPIH